MSRVRDIANILSGGSSAIATDAEIPSYVAGKNFVINGGFDFWQRGTSFAGQGAATTSTYTADRWNIGAGTNITVSRVSASTEGSLYAARMQKNATTTSGGDAFICHTIESNNAILLAGKTVTLSFNVRKGSDYSGSAVYCVPRFGTGTDEGSLNGYNGAWTGYSQLIHTVSPTSTMTTYTKTFVVPSGTKEIMLLMGMQGLPGTAAGANDWIEFEKIQLEIGSVATAFSRAGGDVQGELAKCQRYFYRQWVWAGGGGDTTNLALFGIQLPVNMRVQPATTNAADSSGILAAGNLYNVTAGTAAIYNAWFSGNSCGVTVSTTTQIARWTTCFGRVPDLQLNAEL